MPLVRKRRAQAEASPPASPPPTRRRRSPSASEASSVDDNAEGHTTLDGDTQDGVSSSHQMVKKLVRLALASEYARQPIRRTDISAKVLAPHSGRQFKRIFNEAQQELRKTFGMEMTELPVKEKVTISQKRAAQRAQTTTSTTSKSYILTSILPSPLRAPLPPPRIPSTTTESTYIALYTFVISLIYLSSGQLPEGKLDRYLRRCNAGDYTPIDKTDKLLKRMEKERYIDRVKERPAGEEEQVSFVVGPRGKVEVGERGVAGVVRRVYGKRDVEAEELEKRLERSLGVGFAGSRKVVRGREEDGRGEGEAQVEEEGEGAGEEPVARRGPGRPRRSRRGQEDGDE